MSDLPTSIGPYRVVRRLGEGGMGTVMEAINDTIHRRVAIKVLHPEAAQNPEAISRFINEARAVNLIDHPGLIQVSDYGTLEDGTAYIVMELLKGDTLEERMARTGGKLPVPNMLVLSWQIAESLAAAHAQEVVHRDLKPSNVMIVADPQAPSGERTKVLDFGVAKLSGLKGAAQVKTQANAVMGTPLYMSPEQCDGPSGVDAKSDVYSLGAMFYELLSGRPPFIGESLGHVIAGHLFKQPPALGSLEPQVPAPLAALVHRMLSKDKAERPSMEELAQQLAEMSAQMPPPARALSDAAVPASSESRRAALVSGRVRMSDSAVRLVAATAKGELPESRLPASVLRSRLMSFGGAAALVILTGALVVRAQLVRSGGLGTGDEPKTRPAQVAQLVTLGLETDPPGAEVIRVADGQVLGKTPWHAEQPARTGELALRLRLTGYVEREVSLSLDKGGIRPVALSPVPTAAAPEPGSKHGKSGKHGTGKRAEPAAEKSNSKSYEGLPIEN